MKLYISYFSNVFESSCPMAFKHINSIVLWVCLLVQLWSRIKLFPLFQAFGQCFPGWQTHYLGQLHHKQGKYSAFPRTWLRIESPSEMRQEPNGKNYVRLKRKCTFMLSSWGKKINYWKAKESSNLLFFSRTCILSFKQAVKLNKSSGPWHRWRLHTHYPILCSLVVIVCLAVRCLLGACFCVSVNCALK